MSNCSICTVAIDDSKDTSWYCKDCGCNLCNHCYLKTAFGTTYITGISDKRRSKIYNEIMEGNDEEELPRLDILESNGNIIHRPTDSQYFRKNTPNKNERPKPLHHKPSIEISENETSLSNIQNNIANNFDSKIEEAEIEYQNQISRYNISPKKSAPTKNLSPKPETRRLSPKPETKNMYKPNEEIYSLPDRNKIPEGYIAYRFFDFYPKDDIERYYSKSPFNIWKIKKLDDIMLKPGENAGMGTGKNVDPRLIPAGYQAFNVYSYGGQFGQEKDDYWTIVKIGTSQDSYKRNLKGNEYFEVIDKIPFNDDVLSLEY